MHTVIPAAGAALIAVLAFASDGRAQETQAAIQQAKKARATLVDTKGKEVGTATLTPHPNGVLIELRATGLPQGPHAFHIHENGACEAPDFESAGGHFNPTKQQHGMELDPGPHPGDLPNIHAKADGSARLSTLNPYVSLGQGETSLLADGGTALVIHAGQDDYTSQPSGDAGDRIACGEIEST